MNDLIKLVAETFTTDAIGQKVASETSRTVFCRIDSISQTEFFEAGRSGLQAEHKCTLYASEYSGESICEINGKRYGIYRTYKLLPDRIELYLERKAGIDG